ncbi:MAG: Cell division protein ftsA [candidate division CPR3 bacterium GW2011_GWE2_35_7]|nr:MAG: Cell division protein ftsA [candidate division CPR3 bacterium GW2011_GWE2_35_7]
MAKERIVVGIDIGTSKVSTIIASVTEEEQVSVIGVSTVESKGIKKGVVVDIDRAVDSISMSLEGAERMAGYAVSKAFVSVGGNHIASLNSHGVVAISNPSGEIGHDDISRVTEAARAISIPSSREIIHVLPRSFIVDSQDGVHDPVGMSGVRLEVETHIVSGATTSMRNLVKCVQQVGVDVEDLVFTALASSYSTISDTEKELGVVLVDIGGGTAEIAVISLGGVVVGRSIRVAGDEMNEAIMNFVKLKYSLLLGEITSEDVKIILGSFVSAKEKYHVVRGRDLETGLPKSIKLSSSEVREALVPVVQEIIANIVSILEETPPELVSDIIQNGITMAGGGSLIPGIDKLISENTKMPVMVADDPITCVVKGCANLLGSPKLLSKIRITKGL